jgi:hypothetical protein
MGWLWDVGCLFVLQSRPETWFSPSQQNTNAPPTRSTLNPKTWRGELSQQENAKPYDK